MKVIHGLEHVDPPLTRSVLAVGNFDGVHRAHQQLVAQAGLFAVNTGGPVVVLTFEPHPLSVVAPAKAPARLSTPTDKTHWLAEAGAQIIVIAHSEPALLGMDAERFVKDVLIDRFHPAHIVEGPSFGFGHGRKGTPELLRKVASQFECEVHILGPVTVQVDAGKALMVSSSLIRGLLTDGHVRQAALCLGRPYALIGLVVHGDGRGRRIGVPTANLEVHDLLVPGEGVYAGRALVGRRAYRGAISIGRAPTFGSGRQQVEVHLLDFDGDLYGQTIRVDFDCWLRGQRKFESVEALVDQVRRDIDAVRSNDDSTADI